MVVTRASAQSQKVILPPKRPEHTPDGHYIIVKGRRWRATDPTIPDDSLAELKHHLAKGRSGVRSKEESAVLAARKRTGLAKLGLGERGKPEWWNDTEDGRRARWEDALKELRSLGD
jgi:hypothetical protein